MPKFGTNPGERSLSGRTMSNQAQVINIRPSRFTLPLAPLLLTSFAVVDESLQALSPLRTCSLSDMTANLIGIWFFYWVATRK